MVDDLTDEIAFQIASGLYAPGERLPSVRAMAAQYGINPKTVQVVTARLRAIGFAESVPGVGLIVRDVEHCGGLETWRYLFRFAQRLPDRAIRVFESFLETRRLLLIQMLERAFERAGAVDLRPLRGAVERFQLVVAGDGSPADIARSELEAARIVMKQLDQPVLLAIYNSIGEILLGVPAVLEAMYQNPQLNVVMWQQLLAAWAAGEADRAAFAQAEAKLAEHHRVCVERFAASLGRA